MSAAWYDRAVAVMPGGVNSPVRAFQTVGESPPFIVSASGPTVTTADGEELVDLIASWGALILGHAHPAIVEAVAAATARGTSFGMPTAGEVELAETICSLVPSVEVVRMVNSGTEATASALRLARAVTGRDIVVKFAGCYHGHVDSLLVRAGSGAATLGEPDSPGVPAAVAATTRVARFNDLDTVEQALSGRDAACVIVEPVVGNMGVVPPQPGFLQGLRSLCDRYGTLLVFDEVMTGFRLAPGGAQERFGIEPDLTCLGKVVAGGTPGAAYGGRAELMRRIAPDGPVYQAGTLAGNPLVVAAGLACLGALRDDPQVYDRLEELGARLEGALGDALAKSASPGCVQRVGSMLTVFFGPSPVLSWDEASQVDRERFSRFFKAARRRGVLIPPSPFEAMFLMDAHLTVADQLVDGLTAAVVEAA